MSDLAHEAMRNQQDQDIDDEEVYGKTNYAAYCEVVGNRTWDDRPCPTWDQLTSKIRAAWCGSADKVVQRFVTEMASE